MGIKSVDYRRQLYRPLLDLSLENQAMLVLAARFDRSPDSVVARHLLERTLVRLAAEDTRHGRERLSPFVLRMPWRGVEHRVPLLTPSLLARLAGGYPYRLALAELREEVFKQLLAHDPQVTLDAVCRVLAPTQRLGNGRRPRDRAVTTAICQVESCRADLAELRRLCRVPQELCPPPDAVAPPPEKVVEELWPLLREDGLSAESARSLIAHVAALRERFLCPVQELGPGQLIAIALDVRDRRTSLATRLRAHVPVRLTLYTEDELARLERLGPWDREAVMELMGQRIARLLTEAYCQGGLLSLTLAGLLTHQTASRVGELAEAFEQRHGIILPTPGTIHDAGTKLTHKVWITELHLAGKQVPEIARETFHSEEAVARYVDDFERVLLVMMHELPAAIMPRVLKLSAHVIEQYRALVAAKLGGKREIQALLAKRGLCPAEVLA